MPGVVGDVASAHGARHEASNETVGGPNEPVEEGLRKVVGRDPRGNADDEQPAGPQHPAHLGDESVRIGQVFQHSHRDHRVEGRRGEGQSLGIPCDIVRAVTPGRLLRLRPRPRQSRLEEVHSPDLSSTLDERFSHETRATTDVQNPADAPVEHGAHPALLSQELPVVGSFIEEIGKHRAEELPHPLSVGGG